jgi:hypothetical protein
MKSPIFIFDYLKMAKILGIQPCDLWRLIEDGRCRGFITTIRGQHVSTRPLLEKLADSLVETSIAAEPEEFMKAWIMDNRVGHSRDTLARSAYRFARANFMVPPDVDTLADLVDKAMAPVAISR